MVAFCAICTIQSINHSISSHLSDWSLFRLATLQELAAEMESQAAARHQVEVEDSMSVVDAMARQISRGIHLVINWKQTRQPSQTEGDYAHTMYIPSAYASHQLHSAASQLPQLNDICPETLCRRCLNGASKAFCRR